MGSPSSPTTLLSSTAITAVSPHQVFEKLVALQPKGLFGRPYPPTIVERQEDRLLTYRDETGLGMQYTLTSDGAGTQITLNVHVPLSASGLVQQQTVDTIVTEFARSLRTSTHASASHRAVLASDAERDAIAERLRRAAGEGRVSPDELAERLDRVLIAPTREELALLAADLPDDVPDWLPAPLHGLPPPLVRALERRSGQALFAIGALLALYGIWTVLVPTLVPIIMLVIVLSVSVKARPR